ncbi:hypothetical protein BV97_01956 [Novosphingobium resinovorum]|uniref:Uncharacterized protein n=1 Tax=Novosphingobium resinovorum TaxID=158500 RepID=A0A031JZU1_9SPHN|nr:hypothetical protein [Novosphingobium resinovorum]EZP82459.1 hypothetical protein BV97_01956 [Novosphingobium resinovorum]
MERRTLTGGLLVASGIVGVSCAGVQRGFLDDEGNEDALWRLGNAQEFFPTGDFRRPGDLLYQLGIVSQLALTACVVATGWTDEDCRRRIGQDIAKAHFYATAGGLQFESDTFARLIPLLSPYGRWRWPATVAAVAIGNVDAGEIKFAVSQLLGAVRLHLVSADGKATRR